MATCSAVPAAILRDARKSALLRMRSEIVHISHFRFAIPDDVGTADRRRASIDAPPLAGVRLCRAMMRQKFLEARRERCFDLGPVLQPAYQHGGRLDGRQAVAAGLTAQLAVP